MTILMVLLLTAAIMGNSGLVSAYESGPLKLGAGMAQPLVKPYPYPYFRPGPYVYFYHYSYYYFNTLRRQVVPGDYKIVLPTRSEVMKKLSLK